MNYNFDILVARKGTDSLKWDYLNNFFKKAPKDVLPLWIADMDFECAPPIIEALHDRVDKKILGYSINKSEAYYDSVCRWFGKRFDWNINKDSIYNSPGIVPAISFLISILTEEHDGVIIQEPVYYPFKEKIKNKNRRIVNNNLIYKNGSYGVDFDDLEAKLKDKGNKIFLLCSPHNPVGRVWKVEELKKTAELCEKYDKWIISDEIHCDIVRNNIKHYPIEKIYPEYKDKIITCTAPSKTFNIAGLQISNIIINSPELRKKWIKHVEVENGFSFINPLSIVACEAAYSKCEEWLDQVNEYIDTNVDFLRNFINEKLPLINMSNPEGTFLVWLDFTKYFLTNDELEDIMLFDARVALDEGYMFGEAGSGFERINVACPRIILEKCMLNIEKALCKYV